MGRKIVASGRDLLECGACLISEIVVADILQHMLRIETVVEIATGDTPLRVDHLQMIEIEPAVPDLESKTGGKPASMQVLRLVVRRIEGPEQAMLDFPTPRPVDPIAGRCVHFTAPEPPGDAPAIGRHPPDPVSYAIFQPLVGVHGQDPVGACVMRRGE